MDGQIQVSDVEALLVSKIPAMNPKLKETGMDRAVVKYSPILKVSRKKTDKRFLFLLTDILIIASPHLLIKNKYKVNRIESLDQVKSDVIFTNPKFLQENERKRDGTAKQENYLFAIYGPRKSSLFIHHDQSERDEWVDIINTQCTVVKRILKTDESKIKYAPLWEEDSSVERCQICERKFSRFFRRHHCRNCGRVVCSKCSKTRMVIPSIDPKKELRICDICAVTINSEKADEGGEKLVDFDTKGEAKQQAEESRAVASHKEEPPASTKSVEAEAPPSKETGEVVNPSEKDGEEMAVDGRDGEKGFSDDTNKGGEVLVHDTAVDKGAASKGSASPAGDSAADKGAASKGSESLIDLAFDSPAQKSDLIDLAFDSPAQKSDSGNLIDLAFDIPPQKSDLIDPATQGEDAAEVVFDLDFGEKKGGARTAGFDFVAPRGVNRDGDPEGVAQEFDFFEMGGGKVNPSMEILPGLLLEQKSSGAPSTQGAAPLGNALFEDQDTETQDEVKEAIKRDWDSYLCEDLIHFDSDTFFDEDSESDSFYTTYETE